MKLSLEARCRQGTPPHGYGVCVGAPNRFGLRADHGDYEFVNRMGWQLYVAGLGYLDTRNWFARELLQQGEVQRRTDGKRMH